MKPDKLPAGGGQAVAAAGTCGLLVTPEALRRPRVYHPHCVHGVMFSRMIRY